MNPVQYSDDSKFLFYGKTFEGVQAIYDEYAGGDAIKGKAILDVLIRKGEIQVLELKSKEQKAFEKIAAESVIEQAVNALDLQEEMKKDAKAGKKREERLTYPGISIDFSGYGDALKMIQYCNDTLRLKDVSISTTLQGHKVIVKNLTDAEMNAINRFYTGMKVTENIQAGMQKSVDTITKSVDYTAQQIIAPAAQIGIRGVAGIFKSLAKVGARVTSTAITATSQGIKQTKEELTTDPDVIRAANELINAKDALKRKTLGANTSSGISFLTE